MFYFAWIAVGACLIWDDDSCKNEFEDGYDLTFFLIIVSLITAAVFVMALVIGLLNRTGERAGYNPIP